MRIPHRNQNWLSPSQPSRALRRNIGGQPILARSRTWSSLHSFTSFELESIHHLPFHGRNGPSRCGTVIFVCGRVMGTSSHTQQGWRCYYRQTAQQYVLHTRRMEQKGQLCTTVVVEDQSVLLRRLLGESQTSRLGLPAGILIWCTTQGGAYPECQIAILGLRFDGVRQWTTSWLWSGQEVCSVLGAWPLTARGRS